MAALSGTVSGCPGGELLQRESPLARPPSYPPLISDRGLSGRSRRTDAGLRRGSAGRCRAGGWYRCPGRRPRRPLLVRAADWPAGGRRVRLSAPGIVVASAAVFTVVFPGSWCPRPGTVADDLELLLGQLEPDRDDHRRQPSSSWWCWPIRGWSYGRPSAADPAAGRGRAGRRLVSPATPAPSRMGSSAAGWPEPLGVASVNVAAHEREVVDEVVTAGTLRRRARNLAGRCSKDYRALSVCDHPPMSPQGVRSHRGNRSARCHTGSISAAGTHHVEPGLVADELGRLVAGRARGAGHGRRRKPAAARRPPPRPRVDPPSATNLLVRR